MTQPNWNILLSARDPGQAFTQAYDEGRKRREQEEGRNALAALISNPGDQEAMATAARFDPGFALQVRGQNQQAEAAGIEAHRDNILKGAQIIRQINPQDEAGWQQARAMAAQIGIPADQIPANFDPAYVQGVVALADTFNPPKPEAQAPSFIREADALGISRERARELWETRQGTINIGGIPHVMRPGEAPPVLTDDDIMRMEGGQGQDGPDSFPR